MKPYARITAAMALGVITLGTHSTGFAQDEDVCPGTEFTAFVLSNTAAVEINGGVITRSNTVELNVERVLTPTPATVDILHYAEGASGANSVALNSTECSTGARGVGFVAAAPPRALDGDPIPLGVNVGALDAEVLFSGEPVFFRILDGNRNVDAVGLDTVEITVTSSRGDIEELRLTETENNSGVFTGWLQTSEVAPSAYDCALSVGEDTEVAVSYTDPCFAGDTAAAFILFDPFGVVFHSRTGIPIDGAIVTILNVATGQPAEVFGADGRSAFPSTVVSGGSTTDASGRNYDFPLGAYRFPFVRSGDYRIIVEPPNGFVAPSQVSPADLANVPGGPFAVVTGSFADHFVVNPGPAVHIDIPVDPLDSDLALTKTTSRVEAAVGDFVQYRLALTNTSATEVAANTSIADALPPGFRYRPGSVRLQGGAANEPVVSADGRGLVFQVGDIAPGATVELRYVTAVGAGARIGKAVNVARASADFGLLSNEARAVVLIRRELLGERLTIIGRVIEGSCDTPLGELRGVAGVRVYMEDGTYVASDEHGLYHFEGVRAGTHVVQLDIDTVPDGLEAVPCIRNTRFAGRAFSQFVDVRGGALWRTDFYLQPAAGPPPVEIPPERAPLRFIDETARVYFATLGADIGAEQATILEHLVESLGGMQVDELRVVGHADARPISPAARSVYKDNYELSSARADAVVAYLRDVLPLGSARVIKGALGDEAAIEAGRLRKDSVGDRRVDIFLYARDPAPLAPVPTVVQAEGIGGQAPLPGRPSFDGDEWLEKASPGFTWMFPEADYNPPAPSTRIVISHPASEHVELFQNGVVVSPLNYEGMRKSRERDVAVSLWRGVDLEPGINRFEAVLMDRSGTEIDMYVREVHYSGFPARAEFVPGMSQLVADGIGKPVLAVRLLDREGRPARRGTTGVYNVADPYRSGELENFQDRRVLSGLDRFQPRYVVSTDDGVALIEFAPTSETGEALLTFKFANDLEQELRAWLEPAPRDWVVVGFGEGTVGYNTLHGNMQALDENDVDDDIYTDGRVSFFAKGRVKGEWLMTLAYDSDKEKEEAGTRLKGIIDPDEFYTLYGDGAEQRYDAASAEKLYFKIERSRFYALFGDYDTGLTVSDLSKYSRTMTGVKSEYAGERVAFSAFVADTSLGFARDEIRGDGTSGLYRLSQAPIVINSEQVVLETRDRLRSEVIVESRALVRHLDYTIDAFDGTLFFKEPIPSQDTDFNPIFIVVDYEVEGDGQEDINAGGRVELRFADGKVRSGASYIHDADATGETDLVGLDLIIELDEETKLRLEAAGTDGERATVSQDGDAFLAELEHHGNRLDALAYVRRQDQGFGVGQLNGSEAGTAKVGVDVRYKLTDTIALEGIAFRQEILATDAERDFVAAELRRQGERSSITAGVQVARDGFVGDPDQESRLLTLGAERTFMDGRAEAGMRAELAVGGKGESADFPSRVVVETAYRVTQSSKLIAAQEFTDGEGQDSSETRVGLETTPWHGGVVRSTLSQGLNEDGSRTFATLGLTQALLLGERWSADLAIDRTQTLAGAGALPLNVNQPPASGGADGDDFTSLSLGGTYRAPSWSWTGRVEARQGELEDKWGITSGFLREADGGVAFSALAQVFSTQASIGSESTLADLRFSWAYRPLDGRWSWLDRLDFNFEEFDDGLSARRSRRVVNNVALNYVSARRRRGRSPDVRTQIDQASLYYGAKYVLDTIDGDEYSGFVDMAGLEVRHDLSERIDLGLQASVLHAWETETLEYSWGPSVGISPVPNLWLSLGYNVAGFGDDDFSGASYSATGPYLKFRFKFDQLTGQNGTQPHPKARRSEEAWWEPRQTEPKPPGS